MRVKFILDDHSIEILQGPYTNGDLETPAARKFARHLISQLSQMKKYAAEQLMDDYNSLWPEEELEILTESEFESNLTSPKIIIRDKIGAAAVYFDDAGMFRDDFSLSVAITNGKITSTSLE